MSKLRMVLVIDSRDMTKPCDRFREALERLDIKITQECYIPVTMGIIRSFTVKSKDSSDDMAIKSQANFCFHTAFSERFFANE